MLFTITSEHAKSRLDKFLAGQCPEFSRSQIKKLIESGKVKVNSKAVAAHYFLKLGDKVEVELGEPKKVIVETNKNIFFVGHNSPQPPLNLRGGAILCIPIIHEEPDFLVIDKPAGLVVHQGEGHPNPDTLANGLLAKYPEIVKVGDDPIRPGIVHRLDADASGVMVIAKTQDMFDCLKKQFMAHAVEKDYVAIVQGKVSPPQGIIDFALARKGAKMVARPRSRSSTLRGAQTEEKIFKDVIQMGGVSLQQDRGVSMSNFHYGARAKGQEGKRAVTEYEAIEHDNMITWKHKSKTLLKIITRTGRTHQIRVHLKAKGWPIVGDKLYCGKLSKLSEVSKSSRLMLHARRLAFKDLKGEKREFVVEPPNEFIL